MGLFTYIAEHLHVWLIGVGIVVLSFMAGGKAAFLINRRITKAHQQDISKNSIILIQRATKLVIVILGISIALAINGLNFAATISFFSLGIGFAIKDILSNFISSIVMLAQSRIRIGDTVRVNGILGNIIGIDRNTIIKAFDGRHIYVPNQTMLNSMIINYTINPFRRIELLVGVDYKTDLKKAMEVALEAIAKEEDVVKEPKPMVIISEFGSSSIVLAIYFWIQSSTKGWPRVRTKVSLGIKQAFDENGIKIPYPIRTLKLDEDDRSLLKTMDSIRKGYLGVPLTTKNKEEVELAAKNTEALSQIPVEENPAPAVAKIEVEVATPKAPPTHL